MIDLQKEGRADHGEGLQEVVRTGTVVTVDDNDLMRELDHELLSGAGYNLYSWGSRGELSRYLQGHGRANLYVLDGQVPNERGGIPLDCVPEMVAEIRSYDPSVQIAVKSGQGFEKVAKKLGIIAFPKGSGNITALVNSCFS